MQNQLKDYYALCYLQQAIRDFFAKEDLLEVSAPPLVPHPGMEPHIHPFGVYDVKSDKKLGQYLHTSPEFFMKHLLSKGMEKIFALTFCYRSEPPSATHRPQFLMLEWYRGQVRYEKIMQDCEKLLDHCSQYLKAKNIETKSDFKLKKLSVQEIMHQHLGIDILDHLSKEKLATLVENKFSHLPYPKVQSEKSTWSWDDYFFLLFLNEVEPRLKEYPALILYEYPYQLSALSTLKSSDPRVCERFELYINGIEIANCFNELTDIQEQKTRFKEQAKIKSELYHYKLPEPSLLYRALENGLPKASGIALGVERLLSALTGIENPFWDQILEEPL